MKQKHVTRALSLLLTLAILLTLFSGLTAYAAAPSATSIGKNTATRHVVCTELSEAAKAYYPAGSTYSDLIQLPGTKTDSSVEAIGSPLFNKLQSMMQPKDTISYQSLTSYWKYTDASNGSSDACLFYSDEISSSYNREHVWPKSRGNFYQSGAGSDIQHLRPTNATINSTRSNHTMGNVRSKTGYTISTKQYNGKTVLWYIGSYSENDCDGLVEVADNVKGDVARIYLYVYTTYGAENANKNLFTKCGSYGVSDNDGNKVIESLDTLLEWCAIDPVDEWEMMRNDLCQKVQGNRNVFIDYPELGWYLFGREDQIPGDMPTPSGMAMGSTPSSYVITAETNNPDWGTVTLTGKIIEATPAEGYFASGYTVLAGEATVSQNGNRFSVNPKSDCTVRIDFAEKQTCLVRYYSAGVNFMTSTVYTGEQILLLSANDLDNWRFVGWVAEELADKVSERPAYFAPGDAFTPTGDTNLYALFSMSDEGCIGETDSFALLTETPETPEGSYVLSSEDADYVLLCDGSATVSQNSAAVALGSAGIVKDGDELKNVSDAYVLIVEHVSGDRYSFRLKGSAEPAYLMTTDANGGFNTAADTSSLEAQWTVSINNGGAVITNAAYTSRSIRFNSSSVMFRTYTSGQQPVYLWKSVSGGKVWYATNPASSEPHEHEYTPTVTPPTCTEGGYTTYTCACGDSYVDDYTDPLGHAWDEGTVIPPSCTEQGYTSYACTRCDASYEDDYTDPLGHAWDEGTVIPPSCTEQGYTSYACTRCDASYEDDYTDPLGHAWDEGTVIPPSCTEQGYTSYACTRCDASYEDDYTDPLGHAWGEWTLTAPSTCVEYGVQTRACTRCEATEDAPLETLVPHSYGEPVMDEFNNSRKDVMLLLYTYAGRPAVSTQEMPFEDCTELSKEYQNAILWAVESNVTSGKTATTFAPDEVCKRAEFATFFHRYLGKPEPTGECAYTDLNSGSYYYKAVCWLAEHAQEYGIDLCVEGTEFLPDDPLGVVEATRRVCAVCAGTTDWEWKLNLHVHTFTDWILLEEPTCTEPGWEGHQCTNCGFSEHRWIIPPLGHSTERVEAVAPTCTQDGSIAYLFCPVCGGYFEIPDSEAEELTEITLNDTVVPALGHHFVDGWCTECGLADPDYVPPVQYEFEDVTPGAYYEKAVNWAVARAVTTGKNNTSFAPDEECTRGQVVTFLWRAFGKPESSAHESDFTDVSNRAYYFEAMLWAVENNITKGVSATQFAPNKTCSRGEVVTFLWRAKGKPAPRSLETAFTDVNPQGYYYKAMCWAVENQITNGLKANSFAPDNVCTRGQVVTFLYRAFGE